MDFDPVFLSRVQFAWVIGWHILLPAFTVGMAAFIAVLEGFNFFTGRDVYLRVSMFWIKIFSIAFGMGVVTGIVMPFQIGTNWSRYSDATANVLSPLFAYEGLTAFFLEAAFLGVLLFGRKLVPAWAHFVAALMVSLGTLFSSFWILAANSWMQTPAGYEIIDGRFFPTDWLQVIFNPSFPFRIGHTVVGFFITTGFVVLGVGAYLLRRGKFAEEGRTMVSMTLWLLTALVPLQILLGDAHGLNTREHQPAKLAAIVSKDLATGRVTRLLRGIALQHAGHRRQVIGERERRECTASRQDGMHELDRVVLRVGGVRSGSEDEQRRAGEEAIRHGGSARRDVIRVALEICLAGAVRRNDPRVKECSSGGEGCVAV